MAEIIILQLCNNVSITRDVTVTRYMYMQNNVKYTLMLYIGQTLLIIPIHSLILLISSNLPNSFILRLTESLLIIRMFSVLKIKPFSHKQSSHKDLKEPIAYVKADVGAFVLTVAAIVHMEDFTHGYHLARCLDA